METSWNVYDYPDPPEIEEQHIQATVIIAIDLEYDVPKSWDVEKIKDDIKENLDDFTWYNERIEEIDL